MPPPPQAAPPSMYAAGVQRLLDKRCHLVLIQHVVCRLAGVVFHTTSSSPHAPHAIGQKQMHLARACSLVLPKLLTLAPPGETPSYPSTPPRCWRPPSLPCATRLCASCCLATWQGACSTPTWCASVVCTMQESLPGIGGGGALCSASHHHIHAAHPVQRPPVRTAPPRAVCARVHARRAAPALDAATRAAAAHAAAWGWAVDGTDDLRR